MGQMSAESWADEWAAQKAGEKAAMRAGDWAVALVSNEAAEMAG